MMGSLFNHLWQSTLFAIAAGLLTLAFRRNRAQVRYWLWFSASIKFIIPMAGLMALGGFINGIRPAKSAMPAVSITMVQVAEPFADPALWSGGPFRPAPQDWVMPALWTIWLIGFAAIIVMRFWMWRRIQGLLRSSTPFEIPDVAVPSSIQVRAVPGVMEPSVIGWLTPVLLVPSNITAQLSPEQLKAIVAHEMAHIRRRDNLTSAIHMIVEAVFWFHPAVWWIGTRLVDERERACDEEVLRSGNEPIVYAEGMLQVCKTYLESPWRCVSGVTGSDVKKRVHAILLGSLARDLNFAKKLLLAAAAASVLALCLVIGMVQASSAGQTSAQNQPLAFEVASVKPAKEYVPAVVDPQRFWIVTTLAGAILWANDTFDYNYKLPGGPSWIHRNHYEIEGRTLAPAMTRKEMRTMLQTLLADRFKLRMHRENKEMPVYALVIGNSGAKLQSAIDICGEDGCIGVGPWGEFFVKYARMETIAATLSNLVDRPVVDKTGLTGRYDFRMKFDPSSTKLNDGQPGRPSTDAPSIFVAIQDDLGLKLEPRRAAVEILVVDSADEPLPD
jgi:bla regulator protein BlaR1